MYNPVSLEIVNLFSHALTRYDFKPNEVTLVEGVNLDDDGANSNGSGKSVLIEGLYIAIHGSTYRDVNKDEFIRDGCDEAVVEFHAHNPVIDETITIYRRFTRKGSAKVEVKINDVVQDELTSVSESNSFIYNTLGITKEDLQDYYILNQGNTNSFFNASDTRQKETIGRFANFASIDRLLKKIGVDLKGVEKDSNAVSKEIAVKEAIISTLEQVIANSLQATKQREAQHKASISEASSELADAINAGMAHTATIIATEATIPSFMARLEIENNKLSNIGDVVSELGALEIKINDLRNKRGEWNNHKRHLEAQLSGSLTCPHCNEEFIPGEDEDPSELKIHLEDANTKIENITEKISKLDTKLVKIREAVMQQRNINIIITSITKQIESIKEDVRNFRNRTRNYERRVEEATSNLDRIKQLKYEDTNTLQAKTRIEETKKELYNLETEFNTLASKRDMMSFWQIHFGTKGFKTHLANQTITTIGKLINHSLQKLDTNLKVDIQGYTRLRSGEIRDRITVNIIRSGVSSGSYERYSGGEKGRINVAGILALHRLMNLNTQGRGLNLLCLDELVEGLDTQGQLEVLHLLALSKVTTLVITHHSPDSLPAKYNRLVVTKQGGISSIHTTNVTPIIVQIED